MAAAAAAVAVACEVGFHIDAWLDAGQMVAISRLVRLSWMSSALSSCEGGWVAACVERRERPLVRTAMLPLSGVAATGEARLLGIPATMPTVRGSTISHVTAGGVRSRSVQPGPVRPWSHWQTPPAVSMPRPPHASSSPE